MTQSEFHSIQSRRARYTFYFYYGRIAHGFITERLENGTTKYYLIENRNVVNWNSSLGEKKLEFQEEINIDCIEEWEEIKR